MSGVGFRVEARVLSEWFTSRVALTVICGCLLLWGVTGL